MKSLPLLFTALGFSLVAASCGGGGGGSGLAAPSALQYSDPFAIYLLGIDADANQPTVTGTVDAFTVDPPLPAGLTLDPATGVITGTPLALSATSTHTITASNAAGNATFELPIEVRGPQRFAYVVSSDDSTISIYSVDAPTGRLRQRGFVLEGDLEIGPEGLVVHPSNKFAYVPNLLSGNVSVFAIDPATGWLDARTPAQCGAGPHELAITEDGQFAYVTNQNTDEVFAYRVDPVTGELAQVGAPVPTGAQPMSVATDHDGRFLFLALRGRPPTGVGSGVQTYAIDAATGALTATGNVVHFDDTRLIQLVLHRQYDVLAAIGEDTDRLLCVAFDRLTGALHLRAQMPAPEIPRAFEVHPTGRFAYIANGDADSVSVFAVDEPTGTLAPVTDELSTGHPACVTVDPAGKFAYVSSRDTDEVVQYAIDPATGTLNEVERVRTRNSPSHIAFVQGLAATHWAPKYVHVTNSGSQDVDGFTANPANGALTPGGLAALTGTNPVAVAMDPRQRFAYVANQDSADVYAYYLDAPSGMLVDAAPVATYVGGYPSHLAVDPGGRFLYVVSKDVVVGNDGWLSTFAINPIDGSLTGVDSRECGHRPRWVAIEPTGRFLYVANTGGAGTGSALIKVFSINVNNGVPSESGAPDQPSPGVHSVSFHPTGRYAYAPLRNSNVIWFLSLDSDDGALTFLPGSARAGLQPMAAVVSPDARFLYASFEDVLGPGHVAVFHLTPTGEMVEPATVVQDGLNPVDIGMDPSGRFLYVPNGGSNDVSVFAVDRATGALTVLGPATCGLSPTAVLVTGMTQ